MHVTILYLVLYLYNNVYNHSIVSVYDYSTADYGVGPDLFKKDYCVYKGTHNVPVRWLPPESLLELIHNVATNVWLVTVYKLTR